MKYCYVFFSCIIIGCGLPPCPDPNVDDKIGLYSKELGNVSLDEESCKIFEIYEKTHCLNINASERPELLCKGSIISCNRRTLIVLVKCPSGSISSMNNKL